MRAENPTTELSYGLQGYVNPQPHQRPLITANITGTGSSFIQLPVLPVNGMKGLVNVVDYAVDLFHIEHRFPGRHGGTG